MQCLINAFPIFKHAALFYNRGFCSSREAWKPTFIRFRVSSLEKQKEKDIRQVRAFKKKK